MSASPIRDSAGKLCITPGVWELSKSGMNVDRPTFKSEAYCGGASFLSACSHQWKRKADAALIAEAGTVTNQTNRTPAELLKERDEWEAEATRLHGETERLAALVRELSLCLDNALFFCITSERMHPFVLDKLKAALAKSEGV
jgi:hypothetical protein